MAEQTTTLMRRSRVRFEEPLVTDVRIRPTTRTEDVEGLFYQAQELAEFRIQAGLEQAEERRKVQDDIIFDADTPRGLDFFCAFTLVFSIIFAAAFLFAYMLSGVERFTKSFRNVRFSWDSLPNNGELSFCVPRVLEGTSVAKGR